MEIESNISLGGTLILLALFVQNLIFGQGYKKSTCKVTTLFRSVP